MEDEAIFHPIIYSFNEKMFSLVMGAHDVIWGIE